jgi:hypothetical protein
MTAEEKEPGSALHNVGHLKSFRAAKRKKPRKPPGPTFRAAWSLACAYVLGVKDLGV